MPGITLKAPLRVQRGGDVLSMQAATSVYAKYIKPNIQEQFRLLPDSLLIGSLVLALVTQSFSMSMFAVSLLEAGLLGSGIKSLFGYLDLVHTAPADPTNVNVCASSYTTPSLETVMRLGMTTIPSAFPSFPVYFLATAISYVVGTMWNQKKELEALGPSYASRFYIAVAISFILLAALSTYRLANSCDGVGIVLASSFLGLIIGYLLVQQNYLIFGRDSTNLTGIPLLRERTKDGKPLYVCPQQAK